MTDNNKNKNKKVLNINGDELDDDLNKYYLNYDDLNNISKINNNNETLIDDESYYIFKEFKSKYYDDNFSIDCQEDYKKHMRDFIVDFNRDKELLGQNQFFNFIYTDFKDIMFSENPTKLEAMRNLSSLNINRCNDIPNNKIFNSRLLNFINSSENNNNNFNNEIIMIDYKYKPELLIVSQKFYNTYFLI